MRKKALIFTVIFGIIFLAAFLSRQAFINQPWHKRKRGTKRNTAEAKKETDLANVDQVETFVGKEKYYVVKGTDKIGTALYVWVPADKKAKILSKEAKEGISEDKAAKIIKDEGLVSKQKEVHLAREGNVLLWEVTYLDKEGQYSLSYVDFTTGKILKNITP
nr:cell wall elongation/penicillin-binding protein regulator TseB [Bacillus subtilis]